MRRILAILLLIWGSSSYVAQTVYENYTDGKIYVKIEKRQVYTLMKENARNIPVEKIPALAKFAKEYGITKVSRPFAQADDDAILPFVFRVEFSKKLLVDQFIQSLQSSSSVDYAEKVSFTKTDAVPNEGIPVHLAQINAANAWNIFNGNSNITVAIVDNAVMWNHVDLVQNTFTNTAEIAGNSIDDDGNGYVDDVNGWDAADWDNNTVPTNSLMSHGTHCAGIAAGRTDNGIGIASIGWNVKMIPVKCQIDGGTTTAISNGYDGVIYAAKMNARIISCSWGSSGFAATEQAVVNYAWNKGCIFFASAGNSNNNTQNYPGAYANAFCVSAINTSDVKSSYSNFGTWVDIAAPGDNINSTVPYTTTPAYNSLSGTSMATPMVAGLAALMLSKSPYMTQNNVLNCLSTSAANIYTLAGNAGYVSGNQLGAGRIDAFAAMQCASTFSALPPVANFYVNTQTSCPFAPLQFSDSSLYAPTAWSWTFQSGSPATSTLSNPTVSWTAPGNYSVAMTCSNVNGSNSITKLSYITINGPLSLPFFEGFQASTFLPTNWSANNINNDAVFWERQTALGAYGTSTACAKFDNYTYNCANERDEMKSPKFDFTNVLNARLRFDVAYARYDANYSDTLEVKLSTNCGSTWTSIYLKGGTQLATSTDQTSLFTPASSAWRRDTIDVSSLTAGQGNVMFSFMNRGHYGQVIYLDNINLSLPNPTLTVSHDGTICVGANINFSNTSVGATSYTWNIPGGSPATSTVVSPSATFSAGGIHTVTLIGANGTTTTSITRTVLVNTYPVLSASNVTICSGSDATLQASGANNYNWSIGNIVIANGTSVVISQPSTSNYTLTGLNGSCTSSMVVNILANITPTLSVNNASICPGETATLIASGVNTYSWNTVSNSNSITISPSTSTVIVLIGITNGCRDTKSVSVTVYSAVVLAASVSPTLACVGMLTNFTVSGASQYTWLPGNSTGSSFSLTAAADATMNVIGSDGVCTGSTAVSLSVIPVPVLTITAQPSLAVCPGSSVSLTGSGALSYTWSIGNSTGATHSMIVNSTNIYTLTGANQACSRTATISVPVYPTPQISISPATASVCNGSTLVLTSNGGSTYQWSTGSQINTTTITVTSNTLISVIGTSNSCNNSANIQVKVWSLPGSVITSTQTLCKGSCEGAYSVSISAGNGPFTYSLSNGCTATSCNSLCAGTYSLKTTDINSCASSLTFAITEPTALSTTITSNNPSCGSCGNGQAIVNASGGTPNYTFLWSPSGGNLNIAPSLFNGCYSVLITDHNGCSTQTSTCISNTSGIDKLNKELSVKIYPNPAKSVLYVETEQSVELKIYNGLGQLLNALNTRQLVTEISLNEYAAGIYLMYVKQGDAEFYRKIVVE